MTVPLDITCILLHSRFEHWLLPDPLTDNLLLL